MGTWGDVWLKGHHSLDCFVQNAPRLSPPPHTRQVPPPIALPHAPSGNRIFLMSGWRTLQTGFGESTATNAEPTFHQRKDPVYKRIGHQREKSRAVWMRPKVGDFIQNSSLHLRPAGKRFGKVRRKGAGTESLQFDKYGGRLEGDHDIRLRHENNCNPLLSDSHPLSFCRDCRRNKNLVRSRKVFQFVFWPFVKAALNQLCRHVNRQEKGLGAGAST